MRDRAANGAAIARLGVADPGQSRGQERLLGAQIGLPLEFALANGGADADHAAAGLDTFQSRQVHDVDDDTRFGQAHVQHGNERLSAGEDAGVCAFLPEHVEGLLDALGAHIVECRRLHSFLRNIRSKRPITPLRCLPPPACAASAEKN